MSTKAVAVQVLSLADLQALLASSNSQPLVLFLVNPPTAFTKSFNITVTQPQVNKAQQLFGQKTPNRTCTIITPSSNTGNIYFGASDVDTSTHGTKLAGGQSINYTVDDLSKIYWLPDTVGDVLEINWEWGVGSLY